MAIRTINHPGVEIRELDLSQFAPAIVGTSVLVQGFADKGEEYNPVEITSMQDFDTTFGAPTNEAERYFYNASKEVVRNGGNLIAAKLPYNNIISNNYKYIGMNIGSTTTITSAAPTDVKNVSGYFTKYAAVTLTSAANMPTSAYDQIVAGADFTGAFSSYDYLIVNENKASITGPDTNEGIFVVIVDPVHALKVQRMMKHTADTDAMDICQGINSPSGIVYSTFSNPLTGTYIGSSTSEDMMATFPSIEWLTNGTTVDPYYAQQLGILVCNTSLDPNNEGKLNVGILESFVGSIHYQKTSPATGQSIYIGDIVNSNSNYIKFYRNLSNTAGIPDPTKNDIILYKASGQYPLLGFTGAECLKYIIGTDMVQNIKIVFEKVSNIDEYQIDVVLDAGISTIAEFCSEGALSGEIFDPNTDPDNQTLTSPSDVSYWRAVCSEIDSFCKNTRKDCMAVLDVPRMLAVNGTEKLIRKTNPEATFSSAVGSKLRYLTGLNSSYSAMYSDWMKAVDDYTGVSFWMPPSCKVGGIYVNNDRVANIWDAPAGLNRGILNGVIDLAFNPNDKSADQLYSKSFNYAKQYPLDGFILEGQKTTQAKPSAFDRVNVRRLFLRLERLTYQVARYFVYEPNNSFTRRRLVDVLTPTFQAVKAAGGMYDYMIVCDETNNTAEVIDRNEMKVAILIKPVRTAEFILVDFVATRTDANFQEIIQQLF